jgi:HEAT repeat protein
MKNNITVILILILLLPISVLSSGCEKTELNPKKELAFHNAVSKIDSSNVNDRVKAIKDFEFVGGSRSEVYVIKALSDKDVMIRLAAIDALVNMQGVFATRELIKRIKDSEKGVSDKIEEHIKQFGPSAIPILLEILDKTTSNVEKLQAIKGLALLPDPKNIDILGRFALDDNDYRLRIEAIKALAAIDDPVAAGYIEIALSDRIMKVKEVALEYLPRKGEQRFVEKVAPLLNSDKPVIVETSIVALGENNNDTAVYYLIKKLQDPNLSNALRDKIAIALSKLGTERTVSLFMQALNDPRQYVRYTVLKAAIESENNKWKNKVITFAADNDMSDIRNMAILALRNVQSDKSLAHIEQALKDPNPQTRANAVLALAKSNAVSTQKEAFKTIIYDENPNVRLQGVKILPEIDSPWSKELVMDALLNDSENSVAAAAAHSLGKFGDDQEIINTLAEMMHDDRPSVANAAMYALVGLNSKPVNEKLVALLDDSNPEVRLRAVNALGSLADYTSITYIQSMVNDPDPRVRVAATKAVDNINRIKAINEATRSKLAN